MVGTVKEPVLVTSAKAPALLSSMVPELDQSKLVYVRLESAFKTICPRLFTVTVSKVKVPVSGVLPIYRSS